MDRIDGDSDDLLAETAARFGLGTGPGRASRRVPDRPLRTDPLREEPMPVPPSPADDEPPARAGAEPEPPEPLDVSIFDLLAGVPDDEPDTGFAPIEGHRPPRKRRR